ncbi:MAG: sigma factor-like helix-turn-helix DNA-binding protein [bacterium]|nr:sigma factor-like helix-turn-helix DNA-binding protein [bacterium]
MLRRQKDIAIVFSALTSRQKEVVFRRFGLNAEKGETLEAIGRGFGLTRERVRQIIEASLVKLRKFPVVSGAAKQISLLKAYLKRNGGLKREEVIFFDFVPGQSSKFRNWLVFLLTLGGLERIGETEEFYAFWAFDAKTAVAVRKELALLEKVLAIAKKTLTTKELFASRAKSKFRESVLEASKNILKASDGKYGLKIWPEVNPRGVKDLAFLVFKKVKKPLHFTAVADLIDQFLLQGRQLGFGVISASAPKKTNYQTVHNELIKNHQFILVGRGVYALKEWGYAPGTVKDVISNVLKEAKEPLSQREVLKKVLSQRLVKESTILLNLGNKGCFLKSEDGRYSLREA